MLHHYRLPQAEKVCDLSGLPGIRRACPSSSNQLDKRLVSVCTGDAHIGYTHSHVGVDHATMWDHSEKRVCCVQTP